VPVGPVRVYRADAFGASTSSRTACPEVPWNLHRSALAGVPSREAVNASNDSGRAAVGDR